MIDETLPDGHEWLRVADAHWADPLDATFAQTRGGRWNPPGSWRTLYLNEDLVTARLNMNRFVAGWPYEPEDLDEAAGPHLAVATLPRDQSVADVHTPQGVRAVGLTPSYPFDPTGSPVEHEVCQAVGRRVKAASLRGVRCRSARTPQGAGRELAWFPATTRSRATLVRRVAFTEWFWG